MAGEVVIELPDPDMNRNDFNDQYAKYKLLLEENAAKEDL